METLEFPLTGTDIPAPDSALRAAREAVVAEHIRAETSGDMDGLLATFPRGAHYTIVPLGLPADGDDAVRALVGDLLAAFPDLTLTPVRVHHAADAVIIEGRMTGTHRVDWGGVRASGRRMHLLAAVIFRFDGEQLTDETVYYDHATVVAQLTEPSAAEHSVQEVRV